VKAILTIGGSDPSGCSGVQRDLKVLWEKGIYGVSVITAITAQSVGKYFGHQWVSSELVNEQLKAVFSEFEIRYVKIGMLGTSEIVKAVSSFLSQEKVFILYDPVMKSSTGGEMVEGDFVQVIRRELIPLVGLLTPNIKECEKIVGRRMERYDEGEVLEVYKEMGVKNLLIKGGHWQDEKSSVDYLVEEGGKVKVFENERVKGKDIRGTGCSYASSIVSELYKGGALEDCVRRSKKWLWEKIKEEEKIFFN